MSEVNLIHVFVRDGRGGNPVPLVADAQGMDAADMQAVAAKHGHESAFVLPSTIGCDWRIRFFVPQHEMEMCGHATVGTLWALRQWGQWTTPTASIETMSGVVHARWDDTLQRAWISQPAVRTQRLDAQASARVAAQLRLPAGAWTMTNAATSRVKTLVALPSVAMLDDLQPDFSTMQALCESIGSTGLYPYALGATKADGRRIVHARQFPKSSGYPEDAATGIAAAALWGYLAGAGYLGGGSQASIAVWQGDAMGSPSEILVAPRFDDQGAAGGCWLSGETAWGGQ
ncbi:PhzF family phenazine biosynthesis protein [Cupriavidus sp. D384]|uniref:PhzF family phenazine biosynthesis protein n=1 Tax=Cupriavidus sp. D384 TaxID=1538095 RepID=UPI0008377180|nr:PhzF family phenazine biosynthesis isomerase [Cupriavidus sp. D384]